MASDTGSKISDLDRDSLHILPLAMLNIETRGLRDARLIKNNRFQSVVEMFRGDDVGSGQFEIEHMHTEFGWSMSEPPADLLLLRKLGRLHSYDVYSLRISLRELGISVNDISALELSPTKKSELTKYMKTFTEPLVARIFGDGDIKIDSFEDMIGLLSDPDINKVRTRLGTMAQELQIEAAEVPHFLEDFGDVFLSLSYYRSCMDQIEPIFDEFSLSIDELKQSYQFKKNAMLMDTCRQVEAAITNLLTAIGGRLETFERNTQDMWRGLSADRFREIKILIQSYHKVIGGSLCALTVKMDAWADRFPDRNTGGPTKRSEFIMAEMKEGIEKLKQIQKESSQ